MLPLSFYGDAWAVGPNTYASGPAGFGLLLLHPEATAIDGVAVSSDFKLCSGGTRPVFFGKKRKLFHGALILKQSKVAATTSVHTL